LLEYSDCDNAASYPTVDNFVAAEEAACQLGSTAAAGISDL
jgi:hypothetical protein